ncbi:MAG: prepilin-type N-terminal cleavage/methylation domain-containing protein, partial [bacterium]
MKKGFTLIEMMVVIGIIGVIIAIAVPNFAAM